MEKGFWKEKWELNQIGFHQKDFHPLMLEYFKNRDLSGKTVFVPLCGKSKDMLWFAQRGATVVGCELSEKALDSFFSENQIDYSVKESPDGAWYLAENFRLFLGDYFDYKIEKAPDYIYDRASMIALPKAMRRRYTEKMVQIAQKKSEMLLITMEYDQAQMEGPPFSVDEKEVRTSYNAQFIRVYKKAFEKNVPFGGATINSKNLALEIKF